MLVVLLIPGPPGGRGIDEWLLPVLVVAGSSLAIVPRRPWCNVLSNASNITLIAAGSALGVLLLTGGARLALWPAIGSYGLGLTWVAATLAGTGAFGVLRWARHRGPPIRVAVIGAAESAAELANEAARTRSGRYEVVGCIADVGAGTAAAGVRVLGEVAELPAIIAAYEVELLVLAPGASRLRVYDELTSTCLTSAVRIADFDQFYEQVFGHVPVRSINSCWFQHLLAMDRRPDPRRLKRTVDLLLVILLGLASAPLLALLAFLIRRDGGPALFRQLRIGEGGQHFMILKLRTMHAHNGAEARWTAHHDPRITRLGRILRVTHVDELPQLLNVLRGEMSVVGPRPEQPALAHRLEALVPHYQPRHLLVKPGVAGWAQARCGYAGSEDGSTWKTCHDLYYLRHRSIKFDFAILIETLYAMLLGDRVVRVVGRAAAGATSGCDSAAEAILQLTSLEPALASECRPDALEPVSE